MSHVTGVGIEYQRPYCTSNPGLGIRRMNDKVKIAAIIGIAAVGCVWLYSYLSPYESCVRGLSESIGPSKDMASIHLVCAEKTSARR